MSEVGKHPADRFPTQTDRVAIYVIAAFILGGFLF